MQTNKIIGVIAPKGSGKSHEVTRQIFAPSSCVALYDPQAARDMDYRMAASEIVEYDLKEVHHIIAEPNFRLLFRPIDPVPEGDEFRYEDFRPFIAKCYRRCELIGPMQLIVDEAHFTCSKRTMPYELLKVTTMSRAVGLDVTWVTQKFSGVNTWLRSNADEYWFFRLASPGDLDIVAQVCGPDVADQVVNLRRLDKSPEGKVIPGQLLKWSSLDGSVRIEDLAEVENGQNRKKSEDRATGQREISAQPENETSTEEQRTIPGGSGRTV